MTFTLLMTCVGGELAPQMIRMLKDSTRHRVRVVGVDTRADAAGRHFADHFVVVPRGDAPGYVDVIAGLVARHGVDLVLPTSDEEAMALARGRDRIEKDGCRLACTDTATLEIVNDKAACYRKLAELGIAVPRWREVHDMDGLRAAVAAFEALGTDFVVKPTALRGGRGVCVVTRSVTGVQSISGGRELHMDPASFRASHLDGFADVLPAIVMDRLVDPVHDLDMLAWKGRALRVVPRRRVDSVLPNEGHTIVDNPDLLELGRRLIEGLGLSWLYDCDIMYDCEGRPMILEINPRPSGSVAATIAAGVPLLDDMISLCKGEPLPEVASPAGRVVVPYKTFLRMEPTR
ncbi:MAG: ATP-grasp domain-containing protein [Pseudomonadota bacterium]